MFFNTTIRVNIPPVINIIMFKKLIPSKNINLMLYNSDKKLTMSLDKEKFKFEPETNSLVIVKNYLNFEEKKILNKFHYFIKSLDVYFLNKIKFKGKGFKIKFFKRIKLVKFFFGKSHKSFVLFNKTIVKRLNKYKYIIKNINKDVLMKNKKISVNIRPYNLYTLRGIRCMRQMIGKRKGKKGTYI